MLEFSTCCARIPGTFEKKIFSLKLRKNILQKYNMFEIFKNFDSRK
jgi:hypothetical protein